MKEYRREVKQWDTSTLRQSVICIADDVADVAGSSGDDRRKKEEKIHFKCQCEGLKGMRENTNAEST